MKNLIMALLFLPSLSFASQEKPACEFVKHYLAKDLKLIVECKNNYMLFCHRKGNSKARTCRKSKEKAASPEKLKIAGFNVFNLGKEMDFKGGRETFFKNNDFLVEIINQWDLVAAIELKHFAKQDFAFNLELADNITNFKANKSHELIETVNKKDRSVSASELKGMFIVPPYLEVLKGLHDRGDKTWTLILSNELFGKKAEDTLNNELAGFFYRRKNVGLTRTAYCKDYACAVPAKEFSAPIQRKPFIASFKAGGNFDFTFAALHFRYRVPQRPKKEGGGLDEVAYGKLLDAFNVEEVAGKKMPKEEMGRFSEVKLVSDFIGRQIKSKAKEKDWILFGDFNLPAPGKDDAEERRKDKIYKAAWYGKDDKKGVIANFVDALPVVNEKTTLGKFELANKFDHFIFAPGSNEFKRCNTESAKVFDFTDKDVFSYPSSYIESLDLEEWKAWMKKARKFKKGKLIPAHSDKKIEYLARGFTDRLIKSYKEGTKTVYKELISDHLPIYMECSL